MKKELTVEPELKEFKFIYCGNAKGEVIIKAETLEKAKREMRIICYSPEDWQYCE